MVNSIAVPAIFLELLKASGAQLRPHSRRTLMDHLVGVYVILQQWGAEQYVCNAGLFHSIYGTNVFKHESIALSDRQRVAGIIGEKAEVLAYQFCSLDRPHALIQMIEGVAPLDRYTQKLSVITQVALRQLVQIEAANLIEQGGRGASLHTIFCQAVVDKTLLSEATYHSVKKFLSSPLVSLQHAKKPLTAPNQMLVV